MRLLGLDPGLRVTGWGVIDVHDNRLRHVADGAVGTDGGRGLADRLVQIHDGLAEVIARYRPREAAIEETFVNRNPGSTLKLGQARGVVLLSSARAGLRVTEYPPNLVKKTVVGTGHAAKEQIQAMVRVLLPGCPISGSDAADALAVAICHAHHRATETRLAAQTADTGAAEATRMIAKLTGLVDQAGEDSAVIDVGGVGYLVLCSGRTLDRLSAGEVVSLLIETHVRQDHIHLYGFLDAVERNWFRLLTTVQGVGAKVALAILTVLPPDVLAPGIAAGDRAAITGAAGVGTKLATRIVSELKDRAGAIAFGPGRPGPARGLRPPPPPMRSPPS